MKEFIGRDKELEALRWYLGKRSASFITIRGRRRIGKTRLMHEFGQSMPCKIFSGVAPEKGMTRQSQLDAFGNQLSLLFDVPKIQATSWLEMFRYLAKLTERGRIVLVFDEISWMGSKDPGFLGWLKEAWDRYFSHNPKLILIVCGSVSSWITKNILQSTGFVGRVSYDLELRELPLKESRAFWGAKPERRTPYEMLKVLAVTGGVPKYLEELRPELSAEENIRRLCFKKGGLLVREFEQIFSDLFNKRAHLYEEIVRLLAKGALTLDQIAEGLGRKKGGVLSNYLNDLLHAGFISEDKTWSLKDQKVSQLRAYRLSDNYLRFYLKCIEPNLEKIVQGNFEAPLLGALPNIKGILGLQFENLVVNNIDAVCRAIPINRSEVVLYGPYFQRKNKRQKGCQIDLLIQTRYDVLYLCEIKFRAKAMGLSAVHELEEKRKRLSLPRGMAVRTVLIHVNGVGELVQESELVDHIVDFADLLES